MGMERSGTTLIYSLLANHPAFYWLSTLDTVLPRSPAVTSVFRRSVERVAAAETYLAVPGTIAESAGTIAPSECGRYWRMFVPDAGTVRQDGVLRAEDVPRGLADRLMHDLGVRLALMDRQRLLAKRPGFALKIPYLRELFPDAIFVDVVRRPRTTSARWWPPNGVRPMSSGVSGCPAGRTSRIGHCRSRPRRNSRQCGRSSSETLAACPAANMSRSRTTSWSSHRPRRCRPWSSDYRSSPRPGCLPRVRWSSVHRGGRYWTEITLDSVQAPFTKLTSRARTLNWMVLPTLTRLALVVRVVARSRRCQRWPFTRYWSR